MKSLRTWLSREAIVQVGGDYARVLVNDDYNVLLERWRSGAEGRKKRRVAEIWRRMRLTQTYVRKVTTSYSFDTSELVAVCELGSLTNCSLNRSI